jgi:hypothetical protein
MTISVCMTSEALPGERVGVLSKQDWSVLAWPARPADRRGASLIADGLAATGVDWRVNIPSRSTIEHDSAFLFARMTVGHTRAVVIGNAHYLTPPSRKVIEAITTKVGADLFYMYEDGTGTTLHGTGILDEAQRLGWLHIQDDELPVDSAGEPPNPEPSDKPPGWCGVCVPDIGFPFFRHWCRRLLPAEQWILVDRSYRAAYEAVMGLPDVSMELLADCAATQLRTDTPAEMVTRLRAMQAAVFTRGFIWNIAIPDLDVWHSGSGFRLPTDDDFRQLAKLDNPLTPAIAVLAAAGLTADEAKGAKIVDDKTVSTPSRNIRVSEEGMRHLRVLESTTNGQMLKGASPRQISEQIKFLSQQFGFPLAVARGPRKGATSPLHHSALDLVTYRNPE